MTDQDPVVCTRLIIDLAGHWTNTAPMLSDATDLCIREIESSGGEIIANANAYLCGLEGIEHIAIGVFTPDHTGLLAVFARRPGRGLSIMGIVRGDAWEAEFDGLPACSGPAVQATFSTVLGYALDHDTVWGQMVGEHINGYPPGYRSFRDTVMTARGVATVYAYRRIQETDDHGGN